MSGGGVEVLGVVGAMEGGEEKEGEEGEVDVGGEGSEDCVGEAGCWEGVGDAGGGALGVSV